MTLTDTQLLLLSSASQREDLLITLPEKLKGGAAQAVISKLLAKALIEEVAVRGDSPHWQQDADQLIGLRLTPAGLAAIGVELVDGDSSVADDSLASSIELAEGAPSLQQAPSRSAPRPGSKQAQVLALLEREEGATLNDLIQATGWLPHTTRAALTGLRQKGYQVERTQHADGSSLYRITARAA
jgi:hypothetical protein